jgi:cation transport protein ChaC
MPIKKDVWVFGYASLMWKPDFEFVECQPAILYGYHRALCVYSYLYRGTRKKPGMVAGLLPGGSCKGLAFRIAGKDWDHIHQKLHDREMVYDVYIPKWMQANINGQRHKVFGYIANPGNAQFASHLEEREIAKLVAQGVGTSGTGRDYLENTLRHLSELGIRDQKLERILNALKK